MPDNIPVDYEKVITDLKHLINLEISFIQRNDTGNAFGHCCVSEQKRQYDQGTLMGYISAYNYLQDLLGEPPYKDPRLI